MHGITPNLNPTPNPNTNPNPLCCGSVLTVYLWINQSFTSQLWKKKDVGSGSLSFLLPGSPPVIHGGTDFSATCRLWDKTQAPRWKALIFYVSISCLLLTHLLTGRKRSLLRFSGVGLKMQKSHLVSWQLQSPSGDIDLELRQRWTFQQQHDKQVRAAERKRKRATDNAVLD